MQTIWQSRVYLNMPPLQPTGSKKPSMISVGRLGAEVLETSSPLISLSTLNRQIKLWLKGAIMSQTDTRTLLEWSWLHNLLGSHRSRRSRSCLHKLALMKKLTRTTRGPDSSTLTKSTQHQYNQPASMHLPHGTRLARPTRARLMRSRT